MASIYVDEDPQQAMPPNETGGEDDPRWHPGDETLSPFDSDEDDEMQA